MMDITGFKANHGDFTFWDKNLACKNIAQLFLTMHAIQVQSCGFI